MEDKVEFTSELAHWSPEARWYKPMICFLVVQSSRFVTQVLNRLEFVGHEHWHEAYDSAKRGVLSFSNHVSLFDDPLLTSGLGRTSYRDTRWIPADHKNFFGSAAKGFLFGSGKCVPIIRGAGLEQPGLAFLVERLKEGAWVHIFPEGGRTRDPEARLRRPFKSGIGRLIREAAPMLLPFYHRGMQAVLPIGAKVPRLGKQVRVYFDTPTQVDEAWIAERSQEGVERGALCALTQWCEDAMVELERRVLSGAFSSMRPLRSLSKRSRAAE